MKYFVYSISLSLILTLGGCWSRYDYTLHKPKVRYQKPTPKALKVLLDETRGKEYEWAEEGPEEFDCSGLVYYCYGSMNKFLPRTAREQARVGKRVSVDELKYGDLIFFDTTARRTGQITHVGIYVGNGKFQHASNEKEGVKITSLNDPYYKNRIKICRRVIKDDNINKEFKPKVKISSIPKDDCNKCYQAPTKVTAKSGEYYIQLGSYQTDPEVSEKALLEHLKSSGFDYIIITQNGAYKLLTGPFATKDDAVAVLPTVQKQFIPDAFVTTYKEPNVELF